MIPVNPQTRTTLLLDFAWQPVATITARAAFLHLIRGNVSCLDKEHQTFDSMNNWLEYASLYDDQPALRSSKTLWPIPTVVIVTSKFYHKPKKTKMSARDLARYYNNTCQYCLEKFTFAELTIDHIIPRSKGGTDEHSNRTLSCFKCNQKKANKMPFFNIKNQQVKAPEVPKFIFEYDKIRKEWEFHI